jgi:dipeptidase
MCDTFVAMPSAASGGSVIFGKNSDREPNEAQALEYHPPKIHPPGTVLRCTYLEIPQARETYGVLISRPFWMWGAEMGANEKGVVIGNEAVWTKMPLNRGKGLTGMDLLRLALERSASPSSALETIVSLLAQFGQGGICGYEDKKMAYHNSFIIADGNEAWVLETAGHLWAALKVKDFYSISNGLTIGETFSQSHPELINTARKKGWLKKGETFHFAKCYSDWFYTTFSACRKRRSRTEELLGKNSLYGTPRMGAASAFSILRDHGEDDYTPDTHFLGDRVCAHAANSLSRNATQTTASMAACLEQGNYSFWVTGTAAPCTGIFKPVWFEGNVLPGIGPAPKGTFDPEILWWKHEQLHRSVLVDYNERLESYREERNTMESSFLARAAESVQGNRAAITADAFNAANSAAEKWLERVRAMPVKNKARFYYRHYWKGRNKKVFKTRIPR